MINTIKPKNPSLTLTIVDPEFRSRRTFFITKTISYITTYFIMTAIEVTVRQRVMKLSALGAVRTICSLSLTLSALYLYL